MQRQLWSPSILAEQFELKHSLINMMTSDQFFGLEKDNPHDHIRWGSPSVARKRTPAYKDLLRACPHHGFNELQQLDTFYNALNPADQDSLNSAAGSNLLERRTQDVLTIIENKSKVRNSQNKSVVSQVKSSDANSNSSFEIAKLTHAVNQQTSACLAVGGNTFPELRDNIQGYVAAAAVNYGYRPQEEDERIKETLTDQDLTEYTIKVPPPLKNHQSGNPTSSFNPKLTSPEVKDDAFNPDQVLKPLFPSLIPVEDNDSFLEKFDTSLSLPEYETFINHTEETNSGSTTTHVDYSLPKYDSFLFEIEPDQGKLTSVVMKDNLAESRVHVPNVLTTYPTFMLDSDFIPSDNSLPEFETFYFDIEEKNSGSTTIYADISLPDLECFNFNFEGYVISQTHKRRNGELKLENC
nr:reverse transcriptase domain-containing protein [Tanacetum cinerariifolium]